MFRRIIVGADGSPEGQDAVVLGAGLAAATGAGLTLLQSFAPFLMSTSGAMDRHTQIQEAERLLRADRHRFAPDAHIEVVADSNPSRALREHAERWHADLVVIGSSRHAELGRASIGQTGRRLLDNMPAALAIAKRGLHEQGLELSNIAVGYDGGPESERALKLADELATKADAELLIETINPEPLPAIAIGGTSGESWENVRERERRSALELGRGAAARASARVHVDARVSDPGHELRNLSDEVDLMVIGSRRWGAFARVVLGGVGETLVSDCGSSLVIARRPPRSSDHGAASHKT